MKVISAYPIYVNKQRKSYNDYYLSADATFVKSNASRVKAFQNFANAKGWSPKLAVDGKWGAKTQSAWNKLGDDFVATAQSVMNTVNTATTGGGSSSTTEVPTTTTPTPQQIEEQKKKGVFWDKAKGVWVKAKDAGVLDKIGGFFGFGQQTPPPTDMGGGAPISTDAPPAGEEKKGMSKGMKIGLIVGGVVLLGTIVYFATRSKGGKK